MKTIPQCLLREGIQLFRRGNQYRVANGSYGNNVMLTLLDRFIDTKKVEIEVVHQAPTEEGWEKISWMELGEDAFIDRSEWLKKDDFCWLSDISCLIQCVYHEEIDGYYIYDEKQLIQDYGLERFTHLMDICELNFTLVHEECKESVTKSLMDILAENETPQFTAELFQYGRVFGNDILRHDEIRLLKYLFIDNRFTCFVEFNQDGFVKTIYTRDKDLIKQLEKFSELVELSRELPIVLLEDNKSCPYANYQLAETIVAFLQENDDVTDILRTLCYDYNLLYGEYGRAFILLNQQELERFYPTVVNGKFKLSNLKHPIVDQDIQLNHGQIRVSLPSGKTIMISCLKGKEKIIIED